MAKKKTFATNNENVLSINVLVTYLYFFRAMYFSLFRDYLKIDQNRIFQIRKDCIQPYLVSNWTEL